MNLSKIKLKLLKNLGVNIYGQVITVITQLVGVPLYVNFWGIEQYGEWLILSAIPVYLSFSDIGFASVAANDMTIRMVKGDRLGALNVLQSAWIFTTLMSFIITILSILVMLIIPIDRIFIFKYIDTEDINIIIIVLLVYVILGMQGNILNAIFRAEEKYVSGTSLTNTFRLVEWVFCITGVILSSSPLKIAIIMLIVKLIGIFIQYIIIKKVSISLYLGYSNATIKKIKELFNPAISFMIFPMGLAISLQGMIVIIGIQLGTSAVVIFTVYRTLTRTLIQIITTLNQSVWPEISIAYGLDDIKLITHLHRKSSQIIFWIGLSSIILLIFFGNSFIDFWMNKNIIKNNLLFYTLLFATFLNILWQTSWVYLMAINKHENIAKFFIVSNLLGLILVYMLTPIFGIIGVGLVIVLVEIPLLIYSVSRTLNLLNDNLEDYLRYIFFIK